MNNINSTNLLETIVYHRLVIYHPAERSQINGLASGSYNRSTVFSCTICGIERRLMLHIIVAAITVGAEDEGVESGTMAARRLTLRAEYYGACWSAIVLRRDSAVLTIHGPIGIAAAAPTAIRTKLLLWPPSGAV